jgi:hypothetical protein
LGIEVQRSSDDLWLSQKKYTNDLLQRAGMPSCKPVSTHHATSTMLSTHEGDLLISEDAKYRSIVGALQYLTLTRPDITYAVNKVCQYLHAPRTSHWTAVKQILCFLKHTSGFGCFGCLIWPSSSTMVSAFFDVDGRGALMTGSQRVVLRSSSGLISSHGVQRNKRQSQDRVLKLNTRQWPTQLLK